MNEPGNASLLAGERVKGMMGTTAYESVLRNEITSKSERRSASGKTLKSFKCYNKNDIVRDLRCRNGAVKVSRVRFGLDAIGLIVPCTQPVSR